MRGKEPETICDDRRSKRQGAQHGPTPRDSRSSTSNTTAVSANPSSRLKNCRTPSTCHLDDRQDEGAAGISWNAYRTHPVVKSGNFDALVEREMCSGRLPRAVAAQRVITKYGAAPNANQIARRENSVADFMAAVNQVMIEKHCSRSAAMSEARRRHPDKFAAYQEV